MSDEHKAELIKGAADIIFEELKKLDGVASYDVCEKIARDLYDHFFRPGGPLRHLPAGEVARRYRDRYEAEAIAAQILETPLTRQPELGNIIYGKTVPENVPTSYPVDMLPVRETTLILGTCDDCGIDAPCCDRCPNWGGDDRTGFAQADQE